MILEILKNLIARLKKCDQVIHTCSNQYSTFVQVSKRTCFYQYFGNFKYSRVLQKNNKSCIITSTSETYGSGDYFPMDEKHPLKAQSPYAAMKISADQLALSCYNSFNLKECENY